MQTDPPQDPGASPAPTELAAPGAGAVAEDAELQRAVAALRAPRNRWWPLLLVLSLAAFLLVGTGPSLRTAVAIAGALLFHELGHWVAMRWLGYRDVRFFFVPFFGAATSGTPVNTTCWKEVVIALAGPLPGIAVGALLTQTPLVWNDGARLAGYVLLALNAFNLLPIGFLDGGRVLDRLLLSRHPRVEAAFGILSGLGLAAWGMSRDDTALPVLGFVMVGGALASRRVAVEAARLRALLAPTAAGVEGLAVPELGLLHAAARSLGARTPRTRATLMRDLYQRATTPAASLREAFLGLGAWGAALAAATSLSSAVADGPPARWTTVEDVARAFAVEFPAPPREGKGDILAADLRTRTYVVLSAHRPDLEGEPVQEVLGRIVEGYRSRLPPEATLREEAGRTPTSRRVVMPPLAGGATVEVHYVGQRLYVLSAAARGGDRHRAEAERFFDSFRPLRP